MLHDPPFPALDRFEPTRQTLQLYSRAVSAIPRAYGEAHPKWWHVSLAVVPEGLVSDPVSLPAGGTLQFKLDLRQHALFLEKDRDTIAVWPMTAGTPSAVLGQAIIEAVEALGLGGGDYGQERWHNDEPRPYDADAARAFLVALVHANRIFEAHRAGLPGEKGPVQLWPHGFDLAFEWFGTRVVRHEEHGRMEELPAQLNLGFYPGDPENSPYFYSNPWPFEGEYLLGKALPAGARWHTEGWQGTLLPYAELAGSPDAEARLREFAQAVYDLAAPTLMASWG